MTSITGTADVLYVDDDPSFADMISEMLERERDALEVGTADSAEEGIRVVRSEPIDCVVSDYSMPGTDGLEFLRMVREESENLPFLLVTGRGSEDIASEAISAGVTDYIQKGRGSDHYTLLANRITNAVEQYRANEELAERKRELEEVKRRFESFVKHSPDVITAVDGDGTIRYQSPAVERVFGCSPERTVGTDLLDHVHPEDRSTVRMSLSKLAEGDTEIDGGEKPLIEEFRVETGSGSTVWIESVLSPGGEFHEGEYLVNSRDVTEQKLREQELEDKTERLDEFAGIVSHDLQSPISVVDGRLSLAEELCDSPDVVEHLRAAADALDRMDDIIDATLTLAREGQTVDETEPVEIDDIANECFGTVTPREATLRLDIESLTIRADPDRLRHVFENLFANAVEHAGETAIITIGETDSEDIYVADDGPGIPEGEREEIFEPGYSDHEDGTGFGLAIVEEIVEAHGWDIEVTESDDGGARFEIRDVETV